MAVRAKFVVQSKTLTKINTSDPKSGLQTSVKLFPVYGGSPENKAFFANTPTGVIELGIVNQEASDLLEIGSEYYVDFTPANPPAA